MCERAEPCSLHCVAQSFMFASTFLQAAWCVGLSHGESMRKLQGRASHKPGVSFRGTKLSCSLGSGWSGLLCDDQDRGNEMATLLFPHAARMAPVLTRLWLGMRSEKRLGHTQTHKQTQVFLLVQTEGRLAGA